MCCFSGEWGDLNSFSVRVSGGGGGLNAKGVTLEGMLKLRFDWYIIPNRAGLHSLSEEDLERVTICPKHRYELTTHLILARSNLTSSRKVSRATEGWTCGSQSDFTWKG